MKLSCIREWGKLVKHWVSSKDVICWPKTELYHEMRYASRKLSLIRGLDVLAKNWASWRDEICWPKIELHQEIIYLGRSSSIAKWLTFEWISMKWISVATSILLQNVGHTYVTDAGKFEVQSKLTVWSFAAVFGHETSSKLAVLRIDWHFFLGFLLISSSSINLGLPKGHFPVGLLIKILKDLQT